MTDPSPGSMRLDDFDYFLPETLIAQHALPDRAASRLMVVDRAGKDTGAGETVAAHATFGELTDFLDANDILVVNRSRVLPARIFVRRPTGGRVELLFIRELPGNEFTAWVKPIGRLRPGEPLLCDDKNIRFRFLEQTGEREGLLRLEPGPGAAESVHRVFESLGHVPLPPYIRRPDEPGDRERYQTVYARETGSVAAPTAGLHFDDRLLSALAARGVTVVSLLLHVGPGTFSPLGSEDVAANRLDPEAFEIPGDALELIAGARERGKRVVAVGTTVTRALEAAYADGRLAAGGARSGYSGETRLFIYPGYEFRVVDRLITNFHLPKSSLLLLVCAFLGHERTLACYREAVEEKYRFYSYGDAMLIR